MKINFNIHSSFIFSKLVSKMGAVASSVVSAVVTYVTTPIGAAVTGGATVYGLKTYSDNKQKEREENAKLSRIEIERKKREKRLHSKQYKILKKLRNKC